MQKIELSSEVALPMIREFVSGLRVETVLFALETPSLPNVYRNPYPRMIFTLPGSRYEIRAVLEGRPADIVLTEGQLLCCLPGSGVERRRWTDGAVSLVFMENCVRVVYNDQERVDRFYWHHTRRALSSGGNLLLRGLMAFAMEERPRDLLLEAVNVFFRVLLDDLGRREGGDGKALTTFRQALYLIQSRFHEQDISRESVAGELSITPSHLSRLFRTCGSGNFLETLTRIRLEYAEELIRGTRLTLDEIARRSGFRDSSYFIKVFRKYHGVTPARFRGY